MAKRPARFEVKCAKGQYWFRIVAANGRVLCHSETYKSSRACFNAIRAVQGAVHMVKDRSRRGLIATHR